MKPIIALCMGLFLTTSAFATTTYNDYLKTWKKRTQVNPLGDIAQLPSSEIRIFEDAINNGWMQSIKKFSLNNIEYAIISAKHGPDPDMCGEIRGYATFPPCIFVKKVNGKWKRDQNLYLFYNKPTSFFSKSSNPDFTSDKIEKINISNKKTLIKKWIRSTEMTVYIFDGDIHLIFNHFYGNNPSLDDKKEDLDFNANKSLGINLPIPIRSRFLIKGYIMTHSNPVNKEGNVIEWASVKNTRIPITFMTNIRDAHIKNPSRKEYKSLFQGRNRFTLYYVTGDYVDAKDYRETMPEESDFLQKPIGGYSILASEQVKNKRATLTCAKFSNGEKTSIGCRSSHPISTATVTSCDKNNSSAYDTPYTPTTALFNNYAFTYNISSELNNVCPIPYKISATVNGKIVSLSLQ